MLLLYIIFQSSKTIACSYFDICKNIVYLMSIIDKIQQVIYMSTINRASDMSMHKGYRIRTPLKLPGSVV